MAIEFETEVQKATYEKVKRMLTEIFGEMLLVREDSPMFGISMGTAFAQVLIAPWGDDDAVVVTRAYVVHNIEVNGPLSVFLLKANGTMRFGAFGADEDSVFFQHTILGTTLDKGELRSSVVAVVRTADDYDEQLVAQFGGQRALDVIR
ncbi:MAG: YbjN domain-containing protein [Armatimonadaceae bacterium]